MFSVPFMNGNSLVYFSSMVSCGGFSVSNGCMRFFLVIVMLSSILVVFFWCYSHWPQCRRCLCSR